MGGFMPTPAAPSQPPPVKLDATATSRGNFNSFLKNLNGATPPPLAPMGAMMPQVAPSSMSDIDIFNTPVQMMFNGGEVDDFGDFSSAGDFSVGDTEDRSESDSFQDALDSIDLGSSDDSMFSDDPSSATPMGLEMPSTQNFSTKRTTGSNANFLTTDQLADIKKNINMDNEKILSDDDTLFENNKLTPAGQAELNKMNTETFNLVTSGEIPASRFISAGSDIDILGDKDVDVLSLSQSPIDGFKVEANPVFSPSMAGLPTVKSTRSTVADDQINALNSLIGSGSPKAPTISEQLQENVRQQQLAERGRALGPIQFGDDLANFQARSTDQEGGVAQGIDEVDRAEKDRLRDELLTQGEIAQNFRDRDYDLPSNMSLMDLIDATTPGTSLYDRTMAGDLSMFRGDPFDPNPLMERNLQDGTTQTGTTTTSTRPEDFEEQVGLPFSDQRMRDIERLYNLPEGQRRAGEGDDPNFFSGIPSAFNVFETIPREQMAIDVALGRPRGLGEIFRGVTAPNLQTETMKQYTDRLQRNIIGPEGDTTSFSAKSIPESQLIRNNRGRIIAITDASGRTISGVNPDEQIPSGDDSDPIIKRILPLKKEEEEDMTKKPPNIIGGIEPTDPVAQPTVVDSPFAPATSKIEPISFDSGELNKLIELLTGVSAKPVVSAAEGGLIRAVDDFLAIGR